MVKVRVYELAKDLNMTNRALLNKMKELKIEVKSHMSSLEDSAVRAIKQSLFGKTKRKTDVKVRPSVIRRRKQSAADVVVPEKQAEESAEEPAEKTSDIVVRKRKVVDSKKEPSPPEMVEKELSKDAPKAKEKESEKESENKIIKSKPQKKKAKPAKIIRPAVTEEDVKIESDADKTVVEDEKTTVASAPAEPEKDKAVAIKDPAEQKEEKPKEAKSAPVTEQAAKPEKEIEKPNPVIEQEGKIEKDTEKSIPGISEESEKKLVKKKKKKKSTPAKIVRVIDPAVLRNIKKSSSTDDKKWGGPKGGQKDNAKKPAYKKPDRPARPTSRPNAGSQPPVAMPIPSDADVGKRKKGGRKDGFSDVKPVSKKKQRKKKSVIEGDALYKGGRGRKKRGRKDTRGKKGNF